ncbi:MAG: PAS domain S-box protein, partial [Akkermansiaceae bacterium]|nr:PAS domain S-box protein [Armatimonadota bacterium]
YEVYMRRADGTEFLAELRIASLTLPDGAASVCFLTDITRRRWVEERDRFLLALYDALRPLTEPEEITLTAARLLGEHLAVDRCAYADVEADQDTMNLAGNYMRGPEIRSIVGRMRFADFGAEVLALMRADKPFVVENVDTHDPPVGDPAAYRATQIQAVICVPLHKGGRFVAAMAVHCATPRRWAEGEVELVRLVAERCWESIERARVARNLRESEARYRTLLESVDEGFCVIEILFDDSDRPVDYRFLETNPAFERHTGLAGVVGRTVREFVPDMDESWFRIYGGVARTGEPVRFENHAPAMGRWFDVYAQRVGAPEERRVGVFFNDTTDRKRAEAMLRESEAQFREIADTAPAMLWITDTSHNCTFLSRGWYEYTGQTEAEALGMGWTMATHPDDRERAGRTFLEAAERREPFRLEYRLQTADGSYRWAIDAGRPRISPNGEFWGFIGSVIDIHDRLLAEGETERNRALLDAVLDALPVGVIIAEPDGRLVRWNRANEVLWGIPAGTSPADTANTEQYGEWKGWWPDAGRRLRADEWGMARALRDREVVTDELVEIERFDGSARRFMLNTAAPVLDDGGRVVAAVVAQTDVTARIESERRERFLADLSDRLHALEGGDEPDAPLGEAVRATGKFLRAARCGFRSVDGATGVVKQGREWQRDADVFPTPTVDYSIFGFGMFFEVEALSGRTVAVEDTDTDPRLPDAQTRSACTALGIRALVAVPLMRDSRCVGLFSVHDDCPRAWTPSEIELIEAVAERAWLAAENARLRREREEEARKNERIAETLQRSLLVAPDPARFAGWEVATEYQAAWDEALIGGDFYDAFLLDGASPGDPPRTALVVGDATGKGLQAAQHTAEVKYALRAFLRENPDPAAALARLNELACAGLRLDARAENAYVAVLIVILDPGTGTAICASAGMEPPLILRTEGAAEGSGFSRRKARRAYLTSAVCCAACSPFPVASPTTSAVRGG